ncbi:flavodoxin family protein [Treponema endosymbiont of Eucomonympha sp.]|uniref:flavodoxin family protein n=1 Tax=Treponema endosymbiont of Eucomonympha sp. TaxID=1580831 RepID=UPI000786154A|nr:flavodoxin family protein [Treponema endosymbiont of Eucomonympha sp.]
MKKSIVVITGSARKGGNSELLVNAFTEGAREAGHEVTVFESARKTIAGCTGCNTCFSTGRACSAKDDFDEIIPALENADVLALCTPLYWFSFPAQVKAVIDKLYSFYVGKRPLKIVETALLVCAGTDDMADFDGLLKTYNLIVKYQGWKDRGIVIVPGVNERGDIQRTDGLERAKTLGRSL